MASPKRSRSNRRRRTLSTSSGVGGAYRLTSGCLGALGELDWVLAQLAPSSGRVEDLRKQCCRLAFGDGACLQSGEPLLDVQRRELPHRLVTEGRKYQGV